MKAKYTLDRLFQFDLSNPKEISINDITDTLTEYIKENDFEEIVLKVAHIIGNKKRVKSLLNKLNDRNENILKDILQTTEYYSDNLIDIELNIAPTILKLKKELYIKVLLMLLPIEDKNIDYKKKQFNKTQKSLALLLRQMGKIEEANKIMDIEQSKLYTFSSYTKEWREKHIDYLKQEHNIGKKRAFEFLTHIIKDVKKDYLGAKLRELI